MGIAVQGNENATKIANYLKQSAVQYKTLSKEEEQEMISKYKDDREKLNYLLVMHNIRAVFSFAKKYASKSRDFDCLIQDGFRGLSEAATKFDLDRNIKFITFAYWYIRKYVLENFNERKLKVTGKSISMNAPNPMLEKSNSGNRQEVTLENCIDEHLEPTIKRPKTIDSILSADEQKSICKKLLESLDSDSDLSSNDKAMFIDYFYNGEKTQDLADKYAIDKVEVAHINQKILKKFKTILKNDYKISSFNEILM